MTDITVVITCHNLVRITALCVASLRLHYPHVKIVLVDHESHDETETWAKRLAKKSRNVQYIRVDGPRNLAKSWNLGVEACATRFCVISNNDVVFTGGVLEAFRRELSKADVAVTLPQDNNVSLAGMTRLDGVRRSADSLLASIKKLDPKCSSLASNFIAELNSVWTGQGEKSVFIREPFYPAGGFCFGIDLEKHIKIGRFNEAYDYYGEDWDYFARALRKFKIKRCDDSLVWHFNKQTSSSLMEKQEVFDALMKSRFQLGEDHEGQHEIVSVIIPVYKRVWELAKALESVRAQTFPHWRIYVVNDGSPNRDQVAAVCDSYCDPRIGMWDLPENKGQSAARNFALERVRGKYVAFLDSDDVWLPNHLDLHVAHHDHHHVAMTYSRPRFRWRKWDPTLKKPIHREDIIPTVSYFGQFDRKKLVEQNFIITSSVFMDANVARSMRFNDEMRFEEDWEFFLRIEGGITMLPEYTLFYNQQPDGNLMKQFVPGAVPFPSFESESIEAMVPMQSAFTVIIPTIGEATLERAVDSCGSSSQIIVAVDKKADFKSIAERVRRPGVTVINSGVDGASAVRNAALPYVKSPWVKFLDADDFLVHGWLIPHESMIGDCDYLTCDAVRSKGTSLTVIGSGHTIFTSQLSFKLASLEKLGGFTETIRYSEENELVQRAARSYQRGHHIDGVCVAKSSEVKSVEPVSKFKVSERVRLPSGDYV